MLSTVLTRGPRALSVGVRRFRAATTRRCQRPRRPTTVGRPECCALPNAVAGYCTGGGSGQTVVPFVLADIGEGIREVTVKEWHVNVGDRVAEFDDVCEVESDKATVTITSRYAGTVTKIHYGTGCLARVGSALVDIQLDDDAKRVDDGAERTDGGVKRVDGGVERVDDVRRIGGKVLTTPAVRRIAAEKGIDLYAVRGTGKHGRVLKEDVLDLEPPSSTATDSSGQPPSSTAADNSDPPPPKDFVPLTGYAKTMWVTMEASNKIPTLVITEEVDLTRLMELKARMTPHVRLTLLPFLVKATSLALSRHPRVNSTAGPDPASYRPNESHNIGVAIDTPIGLAVANVKGVQSLGVLDVARRLVELRDRAVRGKLTPADVAGGTFTLSNMGSIAGSATRPLILPPEVAIGALGRVKYRPRYDDRGQLARTPVMDTSWAADHRILDGAAVARFFRDWQTYVENPSLILAGAQLAAAV